MMLAFLVPNLAGVLVFLNGEFTREQSLLLAGVFLAGLADSFLTFPGVNVFFTSVCTSLVRSELLGISCFWSSCLTILAGVLLAGELVVLALLPGVLVLVLLLVPIPKSTTFLVLRQFLSSPTSSCHILNTFLVSVRGTVSGACWACSCMGGWSGITCPVQVISGLTMLGLGLAGHGNMLVVEGTGGLSGGAGSCVGGWPGLTCPFQILSGMVMLGGDTSLPGQCSMLGMGGTICLPAGAGDTSLPG